MCVRLVIKRLRVRPSPGQQHSFVENDLEIFSMVILSLPLIQEGQLSVSGERMCTILVNRLDDKACPIKVLLGKLTAFHLTPSGLLGLETSTQTNKQFGKFICFCYSCCCCCYCCCCFIPVLLVRHRCIRSPVNLHINTMHHTYICYHIFYFCWEKTVYGHIHLIA